MKPFYVYMLRCADGSYYVGHTDDLEQRVASHVAGQVEGFTQQRRPVELVWSQETATREEALAAEQRIKGWARAKKEALIREDWTAIQRHAWGTRNPMPEHLLDNGRPSIPQDERVGRTAVRPSIPQDERVGRTASGASIPQHERHERHEGWAHRSAPQDQAARPDMSTTGRNTPPVRPEVSKGEPKADPGASRSDSVRPEVSKGEPKADPGASPSDSVRPEVSKGEREPRPGASSSGPARPEVSKGERGQGTPADQHLLDGILHRQRRAIAKAITLLESTRADHRKRADALLDALLPHTGNALRLGISGVPGVGKSTFIEALGLALIAQGHRVAVLTIDPSSTVSGGSILGDKTRMEKLSVNDSAYIRPSPSAGTLGGVAEKTREAMLVCEAAGYDVVIVETVGVGQSETAVAGMTDMFVLLQLPNAGDDLQAIKKGVMELADLVVVNKADLDPDAATRAQATMTSAMRLLSFHGHAGHEAPKVIQISALKGQGIERFWQQVERFRDERRKSGAFDERRRRQALAWMWDLIHARLQSDFRHHPAVRAALPDAQRDVAQARTAPSSAAHALLELFQQRH